MSPKQSEDSPLKKTEKENRKNILKKIHALLLVIVFAAGCTIVIYESPHRRARGIYAQHWRHCPYGSFWGYIYWQSMWYHRYPYYSRILSPGYRSKGGSVITKRQLQKPPSTKRVSTDKKVVKKKVVKSEKKKSGKIKKKKDV